MRAIFHQDPDPDPLLVFRSDPGPDPYKKLRIRNTGSYHQHFEKLEFLILKYKAVIL